MMEIVLERIEFYNEDILDENDELYRIRPDYMNVDYNAKVGKSWVRGELNNIPFNDFMESGVLGLREKIIERLQG